MQTKSFRASAIQRSSQVWIELPFDPKEAWGDKERHHIAGTVSGVAIRGPVASVDGKPALLLSPSWRRDCNLPSLTDLDIELKPEGPQSAALEPDLAEALAEQPGAAAFFDQLPTFYRKNFMRWIDSAKRPETRANRIRETVALLAAGKRER